MANQQQDQQQEAAARAAAVAAEGLPDFERIMDRPCW